MLLLADAYLGKGEKADARVTLQAILDSKPKPEYEEEARKKLAQLDAEEAKNNVAPEQKDLKINFDQSGGDERLFKSDEDKTAPAPPTGTVQPK